MLFAAKMATFRRVTRRALHHFLALVVAVSTLSAISVVSPPAANALTDANCAPTVTGFTVGTTVTAVASGNDCIITFSSGSGSWTIPLGITTFKVLVVGGGGGGGADSGSGGGGGAYYVGTFNRGADTSRALSIAVGAGGSPARHSTAVQGSNGSASTFTFTDQSSQTLTISSNGGGVGAFSGATTAATAGAGGTIPSISDNSTNASVADVVKSAGGAGGAGVAYNTTNTANAGTGGTNSLTDFAGSYGGGGGGGATQYNATSPGRTGGSGVNGGGNGGGNFNGTVATTFATFGATNSGGGGGAGSAHGETSNYETVGGVNYYTRDGKPGGSGVVKVRFTPTQITPSTPDLDAASDTGYSGNSNAGGNSGNSNAGGSGNSSSQASSTDPGRGNVTTVAPVVVVGKKETKIPTVEVALPTGGNEEKPATVKIAKADEKVVSEVKIVEGKLTLTPETGFSGKKTVTVTVTENGAERIVQIPLTVLPEPVTKPVLTPTASNRSNIRWTESPNADGYTVYLNGKKVCTTTALSCSVKTVLGPNANIEIVSNGGDRTVSQRVDAEFRQNVPVAITRLVSATITKATLTKVDTKALDQVVALIKNQGFGTVVISEITTTSKTKALAAARIESIKKYISSKIGTQEVEFEITPVKSRTYFNNISVKG